LIGFTYDHPIIRKASKVKQNYLEYFSDYKLEEEIVLNISKISKESQIIFKIVLNLH